MRGFLWCSPSVWTVLLIKNTMTTNIHRIENSILPICQNEVSKNFKGLGAVSLKFYELSQYNLPPKSFSEIAPLFILVYLVFVMSFPDFSIRTYRKQVQPRA